MTTLRSFNPKARVRLRSPLAFLFAGRGGGAADTATAAFSGVFAIAGGGRETAEAGAASFIAATPGLRSESSFVRESNTGGSKGCLGARGSELFKGTLRM